MVAEEDAEQACEALRMVIAGLAEIITDHVAGPLPGTLAARISQLAEIADAGREITLSADAAAAAIRRVVR